MGLKKLIEKQTIIIDDHKRGNGEIKNWDDPSIDVHIDKTTHFPINGEKQKVRIRVPINSDRPIRIENGRNSKLNEVPRQLKREIQGAFSDETKRRNFINDIVDTLKNFDTVLSSENRVKQVLENLSRHFDLKWSTENIKAYINEVFQLYRQEYIDDEGRTYFIMIDRRKIEIGESNDGAELKKSHQYK